MNFTQVIEDNKAEKRKAGIATAIIVAIILILIIFFLGFYKDVPGDAERGTLVTIGAFEPGLGEDQPSSIEEATAPAENTPQEVTPAETPTKELVESPDPESINLNQGDPILAPENKETEETPKENIEEPKEKVEEQPKVNTNALFPPSNKDNPEGKGKTEGTGSEGIEDGDKNTDKQGDKNTGLGDEGSGPGYDGRSILSQPGSMRSKCNEAGTIWVKIKINSAGNIISCEYDAKGSESASKCMREEAIKQAMQYKFSEDPSKIEQIIRIPIKFKM